MSELLVSSISYLYLTSFTLLVCFSRIRIALFFPLFSYYCTVPNYLLFHFLQAAEKAPKSPLRTRLFFHLAHKFNDEKRLMMHHQQLEDVIEDQLSLASIHYLRSHYQEAIDIYKRILLDSRCVGVTLNSISLNAFLFQSLKRDTFITFIRSGLPSVKCGGLSCVRTCLSFLCWSVFI